MEVRTPSQGSGSLLKSYLLHLTGELVCPTSIVSNTVDGTSHVKPSPTKRFAYNMCPD